MTPGIPAWLTACRALGLDPAEVRRVHGRYRAYQRHYVNSDRRLALPDWFGWYRMETASEVQQTGAPAGGCSVGPEAEYQGAIRRPAEFLKVLEALEAEEGTG